MNSLSNDVNVFIGYYNPFDNLNTKSVEFFQIAKKAKKYILLESVTRSFKKTVVSWTNEAVRIILSSIALAEEEIKNRPSTELTQDVYYSYVNKHIKNLLKNVKNFRKTEDEINRILSKFSILELRDVNNRREVFNEVKRVENLVDIKNILKENGLVDKTVLSDTLTKRPELIEKYKNKMYSYGFSDYEDIIIGSEVLAVYSEKGIPEIFVSADVTFEKLLINVVKMEGINLEIFSLERFVRSFKSNAS